MSSTKSRKKPTTRLTLSPKSAATVRSPLARRLRSLLTVIGGMTLLAPPAIADDDGFSFINSLHAPPPANNDDATRNLPTNTPLVVDANVYEASPALEMTRDLVVKSRQSTATNDANAKLTNVNLGAADDGAAPFAKTLDLTAKSQDLWVRIRNGFAMPNLESSAVDKHEAYYQKNPEYLRRMVSRGSRYLYFIVSELNRRQMPTEIALLPMVESAFNPMAFSSAKAAGLWQFIPSTGKHYNLTQNWWQDNRRDVIASTNAALDYLQAIYDMHGDWHLALASYNVGENAVARAIERNRAAGEPTDFNHLKLPAETRNYVPKLQALKNIVSDLDLISKLNLPAIPNAPYFSVVVNPTPIDLELAAKLAEISLDEFKHLNPAHNRPVIMADARLVLPAEKVGVFRDNREKYEGALTSLRVYTPDANEPLQDIADKFATSTHELRQINGLSKNHYAVRAPLLVPVDAALGENAYKGSQALNAGHAAMLAEVIHRDVHIGKNARLALNEKSWQRKHGRHLSKRDRRLLELTARGAGKKHSKREAKRLATLLARADKGQRRAHLSDSTATGKQRKAQLASKASKASNRKASKPSAKANKHASSRKKTLVAKRG